MLIDYHSHNHFSADSKSDTRKIAEKAIEVGIQELCITNHIEVFPPEGGVGTFSYKEGIGRFSEVKKEIEEINNEYENINIKFGVELEYVKEWMPEMTRFVNDIDFDFLIGSVHMVDEYIISASKVSLSEGLYSNNSEEYSYGKYFDSMQKFVEWGMFSVVGHFDVFKKGGIRYYGLFQPKKHEDKIKRIIRTMKEKGIGIEVNTSGLRSSCNELFPHPDILKWCKEIGIEHYTIGADGHTIDEIGQDLDKAIALLKEIGIKTISTYEKRVPTKHNI